MKDGLNPEYVTCKGYGGTKPRGKVPDLNRRVEITVLNDEFGIDLSDSDDDEESVYVKNLDNNEESTVRLEHLCRVNMRHGCTMQKRREVFVKHVANSKIFPWYIVMMNVVV